MTDTLTISRTVYEAVESLLLLNAQTFETYEALHRVKRTDDGNEKAERNKRFAEQTVAALDHLRAGASVHHPYRAAVNLAISLAPAPPVALAMTPEFSRGLYREVFNKTALNLGIGYDEFVTGQYLGLDIYVTTSQSDSGVLAVSEGSAVLAAARSAFNR